MTRTTKTEQQVAQASRKPHKKDVERPFETRVFVSYAHANEAFVEWLETALREQDNTLAVSRAELRYDKKALEPGSDFTKRLRSLVANSDYLITVVSKDIYTQDGVRKWVEREAHWAEMLEADPYRVRPFHSFVVRLDDSEIPQEWRHKHYIDFRGWDDADSDVDKAGLSKLLYYLMSQARIRGLFLDRDKILKRCREALNSRTSGQVVMIQNTREDLRLGRTSLLQYLKWNLEAPGPNPESSLEYAEYVGLVDHVISLEFDYRVPRTWFHLLEDTVEQLGGPQHFRTYALARDALINKTLDRMYGASAPPSSPNFDLAPAAIYDPRSLSIAPRRRTSSEVYMQRLPSTLLRDVKSAKSLTDALLNDLCASRSTGSAPPRVLWLLDWHESASGLKEPLEYVNRVWLSYLIKTIHRAPHPSFPCVIIASRTSPLPPGDRAAPRIAPEPLAPFEPGDILAYVEHLLPAWDDYARRVLASVIHEKTKGDPSSLHMVFRKMLIRHMVGLQI